MQTFNQIAFHALQIIELNPISFSQKTIAIYVSEKKRKCFRELFDHDTSTYYHVVLITKQPGSLVLLFSHLV